MKYRVCCNIDYYNCCPSCKCETDSDNIKINHVVLKRTMKSKYLSDVNTSFTSQCVYTITHVFKFYKSTFIKFKELPDSYRVNT